MKSNRTCQSLLKFFFWPCNRSPTCDKTSTQTALHIDSKRGCIESHLMMIMKLLIMGMINTFIVVCGMQRRRRRRRRWQGAPSVQVDSHYAVAVTAATATPRQWNYIIDPPLVPHHLHALSQSGMFCIKFTIK